MVKANIRTLVGRVTLGNGSLERKMAMESATGVTVEVTKEIGKMINAMVKGLVDGLMVKFFGEPGKMEFRMVLGSIPGPCLMVQVMRESG